MYSVDGFFPQVRELILALWLYHSSGNMVTLGEGATVKLLELLAVLVFTVVEERLHPSLLLI